MRWVMANKKLFLLTILTTGSLWRQQARAQKLLRIQEKFLQKYAHFISSDKQFNVFRWKAIARKVKNKQIVPARAT